MVKGLHDSGSADGGRVVVEKPFGHDLASARELNAALHQVFAETAVFRIDHYLGKEAVLGLLYFRFANSFTEPVWNRSYVDSVQITMAEDFGLAGRGAFYDQTGAIRDVVQNHLLQVLSLLAMEPPAGYGHQGHPGREGQGAAGHAAAAPGRDGTPAPSEHGYLHCGPAGAGHLVKMVHNGIEYGVMAAHAEGLPRSSHRPGRGARPRRRSGRSSPRSPVTASPVPGGSSSATLTAGGAASGPAAQRGRCSRLSHSDHDNIERLLHDFSIPAPNRVRDHPPACPGLVVAIPGTAGAYG